MSTKALKCLEEEEDPDRVNWATQMRLKFSPKQILLPGGEIKQEFFKPKKVVVAEEKVWGATERGLLLEGISRFGVGQWKEICTHLLPEWGEQEVRLKTARLFGSQSLARYVGWKGSKDDVARERAKNRDIGERLGCWKGGVLVEDAAGSVKKELERIAIDEIKQLCDQDPAEDSSLKSSN